MKLYEIAESYQQLIDLADAGELDDKSLKDTLESIDGEFKIKLKNCLMVMKQFDGNIESIDSEIKRLSALKSNYKRSSESLKSYMSECIEKSNQDKYDLGLFKVTLKKAVKVLEIVNEEEIPDEYWEEIPASRKLDKRLLLKSIKDLDENESIVGAKIADGKRSLLIK